MSKPKRPCLGRPKSERGLDQFDTPPIALEPLFAHEPLLIGVKSVCEPFCGLGNLVGVMRQRGITWQTATRCTQCNKPYRPRRTSSKFCSDTCRQRAHYRKQLSVRLSVRTEPTSSTEVFRYVRHADVPRFAAEGWQATPALDGTHHGEYSVLMRRIEQD